MHNIIVKNLTPLAIKKLISSGVHRKYQKGQLVLYEGDEVVSLYYLLRGTIKAYNIDENGNEKIINLVDKGDYFPLLAIFENNGKIATFYSTLSDCEIIVMPRDGFVDILEKNPEVALYFLKWFSTRVKGLVLRIGSLEKTDTTAKFYAVLKVLVDWHCKDTPSEWKRVVFPVSQQFLADMSGVTRESINVAYNEAKLAGILRMPRSKVLEINSSLLEKHP